MARNEPFRNWRLLRSSIAQDNKRRGDAARIQGKEYEERVLDAIRSRKPLWPRWLFRARKATRTEDGLGYDIPLDTDVGVIGIQVKSSQKAAALFRRLHGDDFVIVVCTKDQTPYALFKEVIERAAIVRDQIIARQKGGAT